MDTRNNFDVPILVLAFKREKTLKKVLESLKLIKPINLYISCDGPNKANKNEIEKVESTRKLIKEFIDWECNLKIRLSDNNKGCKIGATSGIDWFFNQVDEGIILEDDTVPHIDFFNYCSNLLEKYRNDERIWSITGTNFNEKKLKGDYSYLFSKYPSLWGWATWKRVWQKYDVNIKKWPEIIKSKVMKKIIKDPLERRYWETVCNNLYYRNLPDTWCYQWSLACLLNNGLNIYPKSNLIKNIGFGNDATHTLKEQKILNYGKTMKNIIHPDIVISNKKLDDYLVNEAQNLKKYRFLGGQLLLLIKQKYLRILKIKLSRLKINL